MGDPSRGALRLGRYCDDRMAAKIDKLPHREKTVILNGLEAEEQEQVYLGKVAAPPLTRPKGFLTAEAEEGQRSARGMRARASARPAHQLRQVRGIHRCVSGGQGLAVFP